MKKEIINHPTNRVVLEGVGDVWVDAGGVVRGRGVGEEGGGQLPGLHHPQLRAHPGHLLEAALHTCSTTEHSLVLTLAATSLPWTSVCFAQAPRTQEAQSG